MRPSSSAKSLEPSVAVGLGDHESFALQHAQRLTQWGATDVEVAGERHL
jgi:hypothetical protein